MIIAVDPGDKHVGVATWQDGVIAAEEVDAEFFLPQFNIIAPDLDQVIIESFVLYPGRATAQSWRPMQTSEMIGAMKWIARQAGVPVTMQGASIKIPTQHQCKARGITVKHHSIHAADAMLHLHCYLLKNKMEV